MGIINTLFGNTSSLLGNAARSVSNFIAPKPAQASGGGGSWGPAPSSLNAMSNTGFKNVTWSPNIL